VFRDLVRAGIDVALLGNGEQVIKLSTMKNMEVFLPTIISMQLAHEESAKKSERTKAAWEEKRRKAIANGSVMSHRCPAWLKWNKKTEQFEAKAEAVKAVEHTHLQRGERCLATNSPIPIFP
jgi:DNA invertase Pin-like site-specific DNA recombinase